MVYRDRVRDDYVLDVVHVRLWVVSSTSTLYHMEVGR